MDSQGMYGKIIREYEGNGVLTLRDGRTCSCSVRGVQKADGEILASCNFLAENLDLVTGCWDKKDAIKSIKGVTKENSEFALEEHLWVTNFNIPWNPTEIIMLIRAGSLHYRRIQSDTIQSVRFGITNFCFLGNKTISLASGGWDTGTLVVNLCNRTIEIHQIQDYKIIVESMIAQRGIDVTSDVEVKISSMRDLGMVIPIIDNLCKLLSLARGTKINWVYYDCFDSRGEIIISSHNNNVVWRYAGIPLIDPRNTNDTAAFIELTYPSYVSILDKYSLGKSIEAYLDAKREGIYLETRALIAAALLDFLSGKHVGKRMPFRKRLETILLDLGITISNDDLIKLTKIRNSLAHEASFVANITKEYSDDYFFLISILDRIFLKILEYKGGFLDITNDYKRIDAIL